MRKLIPILFAASALTPMSVNLADAKVRPVIKECKDMTFSERLKNWRTCQKDSDRSRPCGAPAERLPVILINGGPEGPGKPDKPEKPDRPDKPDKPEKPDRPEKPEPPKPEKPTPERPDKPSKSKPC